MLLFLLQNVHKAQQENAKKEFFDGRERDFRLSFQSDDDDDKNSRDMIA